MPTIPSDVSKTQVLSAISQFVGAAWRLARPPSQNFDWQATKEYK